MWVHFWAFYPVPLAYISVLVPILYCCDYCTFVVESEVIFFNPPTKAMKIKRNKWGLKLKSFCTTKETINEMKDIPEWEKILANKVTDKGLISKIYNQLRS